MSTNSTPLAVMTKKADQLIDLFRNLNDEDRSAFLQYIATQKNGTTSVSVTSDSYTYDLFTEIKGEIFRRHGVDLGWINSYPQSVLVKFNTGNAALNEYAKKHKYKRAEKGQLFSLASRCIVTIWGGYSPEYQVPIVHRLASLAASPSQAIENSFPGYQSDPKLVRLVVNTSLK